MSAPNTETGLAETLGDERIRPFLPLVYVAWADGELTADELEGIVAAVAAASVDPDGQVALRRWLDPEHPPTPDDLELLRLTVADWSASLDPGAATSVTELGVAIAEHTRGEPAISTEERAALTAIDASIGPLGPAPRALQPAAPLREMVRPEPAFDVDALTAFLDGQNAEIRAQMRNVLSGPSFAYPDQPSRGEYRDLVLTWTKTLADEGLGRVAYLPPHGEGNVAAAVDVVAMLGHHDLSLMTKFGVQFGLFGAAIAQLGTAHHHAGYLDDAASMALPGCFAMTETGHGSNVRDLETQAVYDPDADQLVVTTPNDLARKDYIGNAATHGQMAVVFARLVVGDMDHGVHALLVPIRDRDGQVVDGVRIEDNEGKGGLNGVDNGIIWFDGIRVPRTALLDRFAEIGDDGVYRSDIPDPDRRFFTTIGTLVGGRIGVGAAAVNAAKSAITIAIRYAHRRRQFGPSHDAETLLIDYPLHQQRLIPRLAATYAYDFAFRSLIDDFAGGAVNQREIEARAAGLKAFATWHAVDAVGAARQACGGQGYLSENRLTAMAADIDVFTTYEGDNTVLSLLVARGLLSEFRHEFESLNTAGLVRYLFGRATTAISEASPVTGSTSDPDDLIDAAWQLGQLRWREEHLVASLVQRLKKRIDDGVDPFEAFTQVQTHAFDAAAAHVDREVLGSFIGAVADAGEGPMRDTLDRLRALHGLATIQGDLSWFQEHGHLSGSTARAIRKTLEGMAEKVAAESLALVDAFAIPDEVLAAPIATGD